jgi:hypothetical protein
MEMEHRMAAKAGSILIEFSALACTLRATTATILAISAGEIRSMEISPSLIGSD